jgi:hypothetical protein
MTRLIPILTLLICTSNCWCQTKKLVVRIDTIDFIDKYEDFLDFKLFVTNQGFVNIGEEFDSAEFHFKKFPQYQNTIYLRSDSSQLQIPLDRNEGYIEIFDLFRVDFDTLQIDLYRLYSSCNFDTVKTFTTYYKDDTLEVDTTRSNFNSAIHQLECVRQPPDTVQLSINDRLYYAPVNFKAEKGGIITTGNGSRRTIFGKEKDRFHYNQTNSYGINTVKLNLKE